jgi:hypothetical protein
MKENHENKKARILTTMALKEISDTVKNLKEFLEHPERVGDIDLNQVKALNEKLKKSNNKT